MFFLMVVPSESVPLILYVPFGILINSHGPSTSSPGISMRRVSSSLVSWMDTPAK